MPREPATRLVRRSVSGTLYGLYQVLANADTQWVSMGVNGNRKLHVLGN